MRRIVYKKLEKVEKRWYSYVKSKSTDQDSAYLIGQDSVIGPVQTWFEEEKTETVSDELLGGN